MRLPFIEEAAIDAEVAELAALDETGWEHAVRSFNETQPHLFSYLLSETFSLLTEKEKEYMIYLSIIVWRACLSATGGRALPKVGQESIGKAEEANWELLQSDLAKQFRTRSDVFFEDYPQSDILAYMEDALADDEEEEHVTKDGREYMFVGLKTVIDCLCGI